MTPRIVCVYSGTADGWASIAAAAAVRGAEIVTLTLDLGQGADLEEVRDAALAAGAVRAHVLDVREEFAREYVLPALQAGALRHDPMAFGLAARLVSSKLEEVAAIEGATSAGSVPSHDNLLGRQGAAYTLTKAPADAPPSPAHVEIGFDGGVPLAINGVPMALTELIESLSIIAGHHGVGRLERVGDPGVTEAPAGVVLVAAYAALAEACHPGPASGHVRLTLLQGDHSVIAVEPGSRVLDPGSRLAVERS